jgi:hypothetical protein
MSDVTFVPGIAAPPIPLRELLPWAIFAVLALLAIYFVGTEEGATSVINGMYVHEFVHDGRHLLGLDRPLFGSAWPAGTWCPRMRFET